MTDTYSALRDLVVTKLQTHPVIKIEPGPEDQIVIDILSKLGLTGILYTHVMPINLRIKLNQIIKGMFKSNEKIDGFINYDLAAIVWTLSNGLVDDKGERLLSEQDAILISGEHEALVYYLVWEVWKANGVVPEVQRALVGNSEGTEQPSNSSELPATSNAQ